MKNQPAESQSDAWCNIREAAAHIGMSIAFLRKLVRFRKVPFARLGSKALRFRKADLDSWAEANGCGGEISYSKDESR